ncbi:NAD(P)-dependent oxidoreductase [Glycomyces tarimensis]
MQLTVIAATGATGRHVLGQALEAGHDVTAVARSPHKLDAGVRAVKADLARPDSGALAEAVTGADAVVSALGATSRTEAGVAERGTAALIEAMRAAGTGRLVVLSAAPIGTVPTAARPGKPRHDPGDGFWLRRAATVLKRVLREHYADLAAMEDLVQDSGLDWTIVRPPQLTDGPRTGAYRTAIGHQPRNGWRISRADLAEAMLAALERPETSRRVLGVAN